MGDGLLFAQKDKSDVFVNRAARRMLGIDHDAPVDRNYLKETLGFYPFDLVESALEDQAHLREEVSIGQTELHSLVSLVKGADGQVLGTAVVLRDLTTAHAAAKRQREFVSIVSHELRTPLTSISGALDITLSEYAGRLNDKQQQYIRLARESCGKLNAIVNDLLDIAKSEHGNIKVHFSNLNLEDLIQEVVERYRPAAIQKNIILQYNIVRRDLKIAGDSERLTQVLNNLLSNAFKFTPSGGSVLVEVFRSGIDNDQIGVSVFNNGQPIPLADRERIFEKFQQLKDTSKRQVGGTGLGLAISRAIIEAHGGRIWAESDAKRTGAKFVFTLPSAPKNELPSLPSRDLDFDAEHMMSGSHTVLLITQDQYSSYILKGQLMGIGHRVLSADDPDRALRMARDHKVDLAVVQNSATPDVLALIKILKHDPETKATPVVVVSKASVRSEMLGAGADAFLSLPVQPAEFKSTTTQLLNQAQKEKQHRILLVDDDSGIRQICTDVLTHAGYECRAVESAEKAMHEAMQFRPDLILLDVMMPNKDGFTAAEEFRANSMTSMTPIIFLSARSQTVDQVKAFKSGAEDYIVKPFVTAELIARIQKALLRKERELGASPTTRLPGPNVIEDEFRKRLGKNNVAFCYLDLDNLKSFNDYYGYAKADGVIRQTGDVVRDVVAREGDANDFIGHIAGDDFVFMTTTDKVDHLCAQICSTFDKLAPLFYTEEDRARGFIKAKDRYGTERQFNLMSVSVSAVTDSKIKSYSELASAAAVGKKLAKTIKGSSYVRDGVVLIDSSAK